MTEKRWGGEPFWGLGDDWDPDWGYTDRQTELRAELSELCEKEVRAEAKRCGEEVMARRRSRGLRAEDGHQAGTVREEDGRPGEAHGAGSIVRGTLGRGGCASTAMCYLMHMAAVNAIMLRATPE